MRFLALTQINTGIDIFIVKKIPMAAGLGGGSSDAATVLMGINDLLNLKLTDEKLMSVGVKLGSRCSFLHF